MESHINLLTDKSIAKAGLDLYQILILILEWSAPQRVSPISTVSQNFLFEKQDAVFNKRFIWQYGGSFSILPVHENKINKIQVKN